MVSFCATLVKFGAFGVLCVKNTPWQSSTKGRGLGFAVKRENRVLSTSKGSLALQKKFYVILFKPENL